MRIKHNILNSFEVKRELSTIREERSVYVLFLFMLILEKEINEMLCVREIS
jgi:hypothetical protein